MEQSSISFFISVAALVVAILSLFKTSVLAKTQSGKENSQIISLQLQAYERLVLLCDRVSIPNLVSRTNEPGMTAREMQFVLINTVKQEFEHNTTQQIYVSQLAWNAVQNLRDQSLLIINQISNVLPPDAKANDLNKQLLEVIMAQNEKALHTIVLEALNVEAKKLMK
ncbi:MAG TPA: hypothetical protein VEY06_00850 [Flavisolibacter sp.]|jgi:hypothetical protein|nr:hypothetical protein [Flavisolibacter sp.]